jgi:tetratricopeptide (TPR) repeat protein
VVATLPVPGDSSQIYAYLNLGDTYAKQKQYPLAIDNYQQVVNLDLRNIPAYYSMDIIYREQGKKEQAEKAYKKVNEITPNTTAQAETYFKLGQNYMAANDELATKCFQKSAQLGNKRAQEGLKEIGKTW